MRHSCAGLSSSSCASNALANNAHSCEPSAAPVACLRRPVACARPVNHTQNCRPLICTRQRNSRAGPELVGPKRGRRLILAAEADAACFGRSFSAHLGSICANFASAQQASRELLPAQVTPQTRRVQRLFAARLMALLATSREHSKRCLFALQFAACLVPTLGG